MRKGEVLLVAPIDGVQTNVGIAIVPFSDNGEPDVPFHKHETKLECGHGFWCLYARSPSEYVAGLQECMLWRGSFEQFSHTLLDWFLNKVHEVPVH